MNQAALMKLKKLQKQMEEAQAKLEQTIFTGSAGGIVTVMMKGNNEVVSVKIDKEAFESKDDIEMIEDSIVAAINDAKKKIEKETAAIMGPFAGGMPGMF